MFTLFSVFSVGFLESTFMLEAVNKNEVQSGPTNTGADGNRKTENRKQTLPATEETFQKTLTLKFGALIFLSL